MKKFADENKKGREIADMSIELRHIDHYSFNHDDIVLIDDISGVPEQQAVKTELVTLLFCTHGKLQFEHNGSMASLSENQIFSCQPGSVLSDFMMSPAMKCKVLAFRPQLFGDMLFVDRKMWSIIAHLKDSPIIELTEREVSVLLDYLDLLRLKLSEPEDDRYRREIIFGLMKGLGFELFAIARRLLGKQLPQEEANITQGDLLAKRFVEMVNESGGRVRSVSEFAQRLNVTPKYLSSTVTRQTGRHAYDFIREATVSAIENRLRYSDMSAKEIAAEFDFPNLSFFGRFVKEHLGASPTDFRKNLGR